MRKTVQTLIVLGIILVTFVLPVILFQISDKPGGNTTGVTPTPTITEEGNTVRFDSIPPTFAIIGGTFMYQVKASDVKGADVSIIVLEKPEWVEWNEETYVLRGQVPKTGNAYFSISLKATNDGGQHVSQNFTVTVEEASSREQEVKGIRDSAWKDPFHPTDTGTNAIYEEAEPIEPESDVLGVSAVATETPSPSQMGSTTETSLPLDAIFIGAGVAIGIVFLGWMYLSMRSEKQQFLHSTGKLIVERGRK